MENVMVLDAKTKKRMGVICFIPAISFLLCFIYYLALVVPATGGHAAAGTIVSVTSAHYDVLFIMLAAAAIITAPVFIYCLVILARIRSMNSAVKTEWIIFLSILAPVASVLFWLFIIREAPKYMGIYPDIA